MIAQETIDKVFAVRISEAVEKRGTKLKAKGGNHWACCPFHSEKSPSFSVSDAKGIYKCFGCGKGGNVVNFYMEHEKLGYPEAVKLVAQDFNIEVIEDTEEESVERIEERQRLDNLVMLNERALEIWEKNEIPINACRYPNAKDFGVAYALDSWDALKVAMKDVPPKTLNEIGLLGHKEETDHYYDFWNNRLIFPIRDANKRLIGFGGESMAPTPEEKKKAGKYINTKGTPLYNKSEVLFGLNEAKDHIRKAGFAYVVEGYWDVIGMHYANAQNTVAPCGTAFGSGQLKVLKRYTDKLVLIMDGDDAGTDAIRKAIPNALLEGFTVQVAIIPDGKDPDDVIQAARLEADDVNVNVYLSDFKQDGIEWYANHIYDPTSTPAEQSDQLDEIAFLIGLLKDANLQTIYIKLVAKFTQLTATEWKSRVQTANRAIERQNPSNTTALNFKGKNYDAPHGIDLHQYSKDITEYGLFMHNNIIYMQRAKKAKDDEEGSETVYYFKPVSNFSIRIIQHMDDRNDPKQLVQICNEHGRKRTFETSTDSFVNEGSFKKMLGRHGNFRWRGVGQDFDRLDAKLKEEMGDGKMLKVLGWQKEGFWAFSNRIIKTDGSTLAVERYGEFEMDGTSFYIPAGNEINVENEEVYGPQKLAIYKESELTLEQYWQLLSEVFGTHSYNGILFAVASTFADVVFKVVKSWPILFLYGPPGTGKDELIRAITGIHGEKQAAVDMTGESTGKGKIRHTAQFRNMMAHFSEFKLGFKLENMIKALFDRNGYVKATMSYDFTNEEVPVNSTIIMTGNDYPTDGPTISRLISEELVKGSYTVEQTRRFNRMTEIIDKGVSSLLTNIIKHRNMYQKNFRHAVNEEKELLKKAFKTKTMAAEDQERMIQNAAILGATYKLLQDVLPFPFTYEEWKQNIFLGYEKQMSKMLSGSVLTQFWNGVLAAIRDERNPLLINHDYKVSGDELMIHFPSCYAGYAARTKGGLAESDNKVRDELKRHKAFLKNENSVYYDANRRSTGLVFRVSDISPDFAENLAQAITVAEINAARRNGHSSMPEPSYEEKKAAAKQTEAPF